LHSEIEKKRGFMKTALTIGAAFLLTIASLAVGQTTPAKKASARPSATGGPTKVTGEPTKTASGLEYWEIKPGTGATAQIGQHVTVDYTVWLSTGKKVDSSVGTGQPYEFMLGAGQVIKGWDEGIAGMKVGGKRQLRIPPDLAYGAAGKPPAVPANSTLVFDVRLINVK
jgi:peptidylprolyl isomerase